MTLLLTYHRTLPVAPPDNIHVLSRQTFARHIELIVDSGIPVAPPAEFSRPAKDGAHRLGLTFDDGYLSDLVCAETLARADMQAIFFVSSANIGAHGYLDAGDIRELDAIGMTIGSHSHRHVRLTNLSLPEALIQARTSKERLEDVLGKPVADFAFPGGACSRKLYATIREAGYARQYTLAWGVNSPLHTASGVFGRNCVVQGMDEAYFQRLISGRNRFARRMHYLLKGAALQLLPGTAYRHLRQRYLVRSGQ